MPRVRVAFWADKALAESFRAACAARGITQSEMARELMRGWLDVDGGPFVVMRLDIAEFLVDLVESMGNGAGQEAEAARQNSQEVSDA